MLVLKMTYFYRAYGIKKKLIYISQNLIQFSRYSGE